ncbi:MAG: insulinase family protein [Bacteroidia bacterium]|nr:insulinase family protein [Bacteroidia bacterium]
MKKMLLFPILLLTTALFTQVPAPVAPKAKLVQTVTKKGNEIVIPYQRWVLPNGLTVLIHEDHSDPIVHVDMTYHVGSNREQPGRSGFAHFFEHMMFQGSDNVADEEHFRIVTECGGTLNGTTNLDRTNYFETLPSNMLEIGLWLEADRMGFLLDAVTQQKFEIQRSTVKNERGQNYDNRPYGLVNEKVIAALYPKNHPYSWPTIGYIEDLNRVDVNDLKKFFLRWYGPNNAVLTVAGDVDPKQVIALVEKYYGSIPRGPEVKNLPKSSVSIDKDRYISYEDNIRFPLLQFNWPTASSFTDDEAALDVLANLLSGSSKGSIFYNNFIKTNKAVNASVSNPSSELHGRFTVTVLPYPMYNLSQMDSMIRSALIEFEKKGVSDEDLKKFKATHEADVINSLSSVSGKASQLAAYFTFTGNADFIKVDLQRYQKVTKEDVMRVYNKYIKGKPAVIISVYPKGKPEMKAKEDTYVSPPRDLNTPESEEYKNLKYVKAKDSFDRSKKPQPGPNPVIKVPDYWQETLPNGLKLIGTRSDELPSITMQINIEIGHRFEDPSKAGIANLLADLLNESTQKTAAEKISDQLELLGSEISVSAGLNDITYTINSLTKNLDATLKILEEMMFFPKFDSLEFKRSKKMILESIENQKTQPTVIADNVFRKLMYGQGSVLSTPVIGTKESVGQVSLEDVIAYYNSNFSPSVTNVVVVGDVSKELLLPKIEFLKKWNNKKVVRSLPPAPAPVNKTTVYFVDKSKAAQTEFRFGHPSIPYDATGDYYKSTLMNFPLGGGFSGRINLFIREEKGWAYNAYGFFRGSKYDGSWYAFAGIRADATDSALGEFMRIIKEYHTTGITEKELSFTKNSIGQSDALKFEQPGQKAGFLLRLLDYNLDKTYIEKQGEILKTITKADLDAYAKKMLQPENMIITVVGDKEKWYAGIEKKAKELGYEVVELDADGNIIVKVPPKEEKKEEIKPPYNYETKDKKNPKKKKKKD